MRGRHRRGAIAAATTIVATVVATVAPAAAQEGTAFEFAPAWQRVAATFRSQCEAAHVVGASLMFVHGADELGFAAFGDADRTGEHAVDRDTIYHWASCTKTFTGIAAMQLRDRGLLRLDQPIVDFAPELREVHDPFGPISAITIRHLLTHSAGFRGPTWPWGGDKPWHPHEPTRWAQLVAMMPYTEVEFAPGSRFSYSNPGIVFVGHAIEQLTGEDFEVQLEKNVLRPLGMADSYFDVTPYHLQRHRSHSYAVAANGAIADHGADFDTGITVSNGGLNAPLPDMARYLAFLLGACPEGSDAAAVLSRQSLAEMWEPGLPVASDGGDHIGLCFFVMDRGGQRFVGHTGGQRDFVSFFYVHPASGTGALAAFNTSTAGPVMTAVRTACMEQLSMPMARAAGRDQAGGEVAWQGRTLRLQRGGNGGSQLVLTVPTGGYELALEHTGGDGTAAVANLKLTTPAADAIVAQLVTNLTVDLPAAELARKQSLRVRIATWQRGVQYFVAPAHEQAAEFPLR